MTSLEVAHKYNIIDKELYYKKLSDKSIKYVLNSESLFDSTELSIQTFFQMQNYQFKENTIYYRYNVNEYPLSLYNNKKENLFTKLILNNGKFIWYGNFQMPCILIFNQGKCDRTKTMQILVRIINSLFRDHPIQIFFNKLSGNSGQRNIKKFMEEYEINSNLKGVEFSFIHQLSPHYPYNVDKQCNNLSNSEVNSQSNIEGYKNSYICVFNEILEFIDYIDLNIENYIVIVQGDHGWSFDKTNNKRSIFNIIKSSDNCINDQNLPTNSVDTSKFLYNCIFDKKISYEKQSFAKKINENDESILFKIEYN